MIKCMVGPAKTVKLTSQKSLLVIAKMIKMLKWNPPNVQLEPGENAQLKRHKCLFDPPKMPI